MEAEAHLAGATTKKQWQKPDFYLIDRDDINYTKQYNDFNENTVMVAWLFDHAVANNAGSTRTKSVPIIHQQAETVSANQLFYS